MQKQSRSPTKKLVPTIEITKLKGFRDRVTASIGMKLQVEKFVFDASPHYSYSTDVGMYDADETLEEAKDRANDFINSAMQEVVAQIEKERKKRKQKRSV